MWESLELESGPGTVVGQIEAVAQAPQQILVQQAQGCGRQLQPAGHPAAAGLPLARRRCSSQTAAASHPEENTITLPDGKAFPGLCSAAVRPPSHSCVYEATKLHEDSSRWKRHKTFSWVCAQMLKTSSTGKGPAGPLKAD